LGDACRYAKGLASRQPMNIPNIDFRALFVLYLRLNNDSASCRPFASSTTFLKSIMSSSSQQYSNNELTLATSKEGALKDGPSQAHRPMTTVRIIFFTTTLGLVCFFAALVLLPEGISTTVAYTVLILAIGWSYLTAFRGGFLGLRKG